MVAMSVPEAHPGVGETSICADIQYLYECQINWGKKVQLSNIKEGWQDMLCTQHGCGCDIICCAASAASG